MDVLPKAKMLRLTVSTPGIRLDSYLAKAFPQFSRAYLQKLIEQGNILVNQRKAKASRKLAGEDRITIEFPPSPGLPKVESIPLNIIYEDNEIIVVDKPAGLTIHPAPWHPDHTLVNAILAHCPGLEGGGELVRPGIVHRLDKDTSGLIVVAKSESARVSLINQFKGKTVTKSYLVLVKGRVFPGQGTIELPIGRDPRNRKRMAIVEGGREAITHYQVNRYFGDYTLLEVMPKTGRTHQIRVHLATIGYPVVGDPVYGVKLAYLGRQFIHARRLGFCSPSTDQYLEFSSPLPEELQQVLEMLPH
ncbi:Ribosomal large subunit pseudouridine synthase D [subsurface metagenome]